jgi:hypothetical protein
MAGQRPHVRQHVARLGAFQLLVFDPDLNPSEVFYGIRNGRAIAEGDIDLGAADEVRRRTGFARLVALVSHLSDPTDLQDAAYAGVQADLASIRAVVERDRLTYGITPRISSGCSCGVCT